MTLRVIDRDTVRRLLTYEVCTPLMREAMMALSAGRTQQLLRQIIDLGDGRLFGVMPGAAGAAFGAKLISVYPGNAARGLQSHQGVIVLFDPPTGEPLSVIHAGEVTEIRTAAASAAATQVLAREGASVLAILGTGEQAEAHAQAISQARPISELRLWGRRPDAALRLAATLSATLAAPIRVHDTVREAVAGADIVCAVTAAATPILEGAWLDEGAHVNLVGSSHAGPREADDALVARSRFFADHLDGVRAQGAEFLHAKAAGLVGDDHILGEIGQVMAGALVGRRTDRDITVYKSLGCVAQDLVSGAYIHARALRDGLGDVVAF